MRRPGPLAELGGPVVAVALTGTLQAAGSPAVAQFAVGAVALAALAAIVGRQVRLLGRMWPARATGILQATVGNLPELLFGIFALRDGLPGLVQATVVGSVLANVLLVLGVAFVIGAGRRGPQRLAVQPARDVATVLLTATAVVVVVSVVALAQTPAAHHVRGMSVVGAVVLLVGYGASLVHGQLAGDRLGDPLPDPARVVERPVPRPARRAEGDPGAPRPAGRPPWSWPVAVLAVTSLAAAAVADWFVAAVQPALHQLGVTPVFTGVVVVAIAGNAVEQVGSLALAADGRTSHAVLAILESSAQVLLGVYPLLVVVGTGLGVALTLAVPPLLVVALSVGSLVAMAVVVDGEATWLEGCCLVGLYAVVAAAAWWGG